MVGHPYPLGPAKNRATRPHAHAQSTMVAPGKDNRPPKGVEQKPPERRACGPRPPVGATLPRRFRAQARLTPAPLCCPPGRRAADLCAQAWPQGKGKADLSLRVGEARCGQPAGVGNPAPDEGGAGLPTPGRLSTPLSRWGRGSAPIDPARGRSALPAGAYYVQSEKQTSGRPHECSTRLATLTS